VTRGVNHPHEKAARFGYLLSEVEVIMKMILGGHEHDVPTALARAQLYLGEAKQIMGEISREALERMKL